MRILRKCYNIIAKLTKKKKKKKKTREKRQIENKITLRNNTSSKTDTPCPTLIN